MCAGKSLFKTSLASCWQLLTCLLLLRCLLLVRLLHEQTRNSSFLPSVCAPARYNDAAVSPSGYFSQAALSCDSTFEPVVLSTFAKAQ